MALDRDIAKSEGGRLHRLLRRWRGLMGRHPLLLLLYRCLLTALGFLFILAGLIMLVTPGPGWLFIFLGMGLWGTEFHWAHRLNVWVKAKVLALWWSWESTRYKKQLAKNQQIWRLRPDPHHYCPDGQHYHRGSADHL